jgi:hypothetical protein
MSNKPDFLIVGAAKAGTTSLYYYLKQHNQVWFPELKETKYFSSKIKPYPQKGIGDWSIDNAAITNSKDYYQLFSNCPNGKIKGEASPDYLLFSKKVAPLIYEELGDVPIIISVRNPIDRAFSAYMNLVRDNREHLDFRRALNEEEKRINSNWDFMWHYKESGNYVNQIDGFKKVFSRVKVILFDDLISAPTVICNEIFSFLKVSPKNKIDTTSYNPSGVPKNIAIKYLLDRRLKTAVFLRELIKFLIPRKVLENVAKNSLSKMQISEEDFLYLKEYFSDEIKSLENYLNRDLSHWTKWQRH